MSSKRYRSVVEKTESRQRADRERERERVSERHRVKHLIHTAKGWNCCADAGGRLACPANKPVFCTRYSADFLCLPALVNPRARELSHTLPVLSQLQMLFLQRLV